jgi:hypothetical protein
VSAEFNGFASGLIAMGYLVTSAFFARFWQGTRDPLFAAFGVAFLLLCIAQALSVVLGLPLEERSWLFLIRLLAFIILLIAILGKNLRR